MVNPALDPPIPFPPPLPARENPFGEETASQGHKEAPEARERQLGAKGQGEEFCYGVHGVSTAQIQTVSPLPQRI